MWPRTPEGLLVPVCCESCGPSTVGGVGVHGDSTLSLTPEQAAVVGTWHYTCAAGTDTGKVGLPGGIVCPRSETTAFGGKTRGGDIWKKNR